MTPHDLLAAFDILVEAPNGIARLRELILQLAIRGKLGRVCKLCFGLYISYYE